MKSLIVEDDFTSRLLMQKFLAPYGESHVAVNGKEAVAAFKNAISLGEPYHLVCLDIMIRKWMDIRHSRRSEHLRKV